MGKSAGKSAIPASPIFVGKDERVVYVSRWVGDRWAGRKYMKVGRGRQWGQNLHQRWNLLRNGGQDLLYILFSAGIGFKIEMFVIQL